MKKNLNTLTAAELKELAKELKIKNWWTLKKADLIAEIEKVQPEAEPQAEEENEPESEITDTEQQEENETEENEKPEDEDLITLKEIISELGIKGTKARRILRGLEIQRPYKRWEWHKEEHKEIIQMVKEALTK